MDGGATRVRAQAVAYEDRVENEPLLRPQGPTHQRLFPQGLFPHGLFPRGSSPPFRPTLLREQILQHESREYCLPDHERDLGHRWARNVAECIHETLKGDETQSILVGIAMPGLKTVDGRGIAVMKNGPRIPDFADRVEEKLSELGVVLTRSLPPIASDGACCGLGEQLGRCGSFSGVQNAYYIGSGTGLAEALKLGGRLMSLDDVSEWMLRAWQLRPETSAGHVESYEDVISASGINRRFKEMRGPWSGPQYPEVAAREGNPLAIQVLNDAARALADLIHDRLCVVRGGKHTRLGFGATHRDRRGDHEYVGTLLDRVVLGQRFAKLYSNVRIADYFKSVLDERLVARLEAHPDGELRRHMMQSGQLVPGRVVASRQSGAPLLGAAGAAWRLAGGL